MSDNNNQCQTGAVQQEIDSSYWRPRVLGELYVAVVVICFLLTPFNVN